MRKWLWILHQWLGLATCLGLFLWGLSGLMHPLMSRLQPKPAQFMAPKQSIDLSHALPLSTVLQQRHLEPIRGVGLATIGAQSYYRIQPIENSPARYFSIHTGQELPEGDRLYAETLARHYTGLINPKNAPIKSIRFLKRFDDDYDAVNKLLPIWRVVFAHSNIQPNAQPNTQSDARSDDLRAYIDTEQARLATLSNPTRQRLSTFFRVAHTWSFLEDSPRLHVILATSLLGCIIFSALSGIYFYLLLRRTAVDRLHGRPLTRWHRRLGIIVSLAAISSATSGTYHLLHNTVRKHAVIISQPGFYAVNLKDKGWKKLTEKPLARLNLATLNNRIVWLATPSIVDAASGPRAQVALLTTPEPDEHAHHQSGSDTKANLDPVRPKTKMSNALVIDAEDGSTLPEASTKLARHLAAQYAHQAVADITSIEWITAFGGEYGFFNKRLPVYKVAFKGPHHPRYYVEPATGALATRIDDNDALEGQSFAYLHKWQFFDAKKDIRDSLLALFALGHVIVASVGFTLFMRIRKLSRPIIFQ